MLVQYVDHYGDDLFVANNARRSFGKEYTEWRSAEDGPRFPGGRSDEDLVNDLADEEHELPFRHAKVTLDLDAALPVARQLGKHQVGFDWSEVSRRYIARGLEFERIGTTWRAAPAVRRQGSDGLLPIEVQARLSAREEAVISFCIEQYEGALRDGACMEQARYLLPQSMMVLWRWTGSLLGWANLVKRRTHEGVQLETQEVAREIDRIIRPLYPVAWPALVGEPK